MYGFLLQCIFSDRPSASLCPLLFTMSSALFRNATRRLSTMYKKVSAAPGGVLKVRLPKTCNVNIAPLNPHKDDWDHVRVWHDDDDAVSELKIKAESLQGHTHVILEAIKEVAYVNVELPGLFDLDIETGHGDVTIDGTIEGNVRVHSEHGDITVEKLKSMVVDFRTRMGKVSAKILQGNIAVETMTGDIEIGKMQGPSVTITTSSGDVKAQAMYVVNASISTVSGDVVLKGAQGSTCINTGSGDSQIRAVQGSLDVNSGSGDIGVQLSDPTTISLESGCGDISVSIPDKLVDLDLQSDEISIDPQLVLNNMVRDSSTGFIQGKYGSTDTNSTDISAFQQGRTSLVKAKAELGSINLKLEKWGSQFLNSATS